jgi:putative nucleotidyltransferase with HDIG domain
MSLLARLGLSRKHSTTQGLAPASALRSGLFVKTVLLTSFVVAVILLFPRYKTSKIAFTVGEAWRADEVIAPYTFALHKSAAEIEEEKAEIRRLNPPIFHLDERVDFRITSRLDSIFKTVNQKVEEYARWKLSKEASRAADSVRFFETLNRERPLGLDRSGWKPLFRSYIESKTQEASGNTSRFAAVDIRLKIEFVLAEVFRDGVINIPKSAIPNDDITFRVLSQRTEKSVYLVRTRDLDETREYAAFRLSKLLPMEESAVAIAIFNAVIEPNYIFNERETRNRESEALSNFSLTKGAVPVGTSIIRKGEILTPDKANMLASLEKAKMERTTDFEKWQQFAGDTLVLLCVLTVFFMYLFLYRRPIFDNNVHLLLVLISLFIVCLAGSFSTRLEAYGEWVVPVTIAPVVLTIIFDSRVGIFSSLTLAMVIGLMQSNDFEYVVATVSASSMAVYSVRDLRNRSQFFFVTPGLILLTYLLVLFGFSLSKLGAWNVLYDKMIMVLVNALLIFFAFPLILFFEKLFGVTTDITLLELSDTNRPLLKALMMHASGTFHHSLQVANLSEAAADSIGANAMLCRVGAYYHDIGKMEHPEFFVENQKGGNPHDNLNPTESARIIRSHVADGLVMADEEGLPAVIKDFIRTHHGNSLIKFFYEKAREDNPDIPETDFRYPGPLPATKETGIVLLADGIEAIARSMSDPSPAKLEAMIDRFIDERIAEGQLSYTPLTFEDIFKIKQAFLSILAGMYHARVKYPGQERLEAAESAETGVVSDSE